MLALAAAPAHGQSPSVSAEEAVEKQRRTLLAFNRGCARTGDGEEIVVCGERERHRLPLPVTADPGLRLAGETASTVELTKEETCTNIGPTRGCPTIDILGIGLMIGKVIVDKVVVPALEGDD